MKKFNKTIAVLCSATMILGSSLTAFATAPTSTGGAGNMLAYNYDTIVVPTAIKVTFNPQGLAVKTGVDDDGEAITSNEKIVSLNYGIASKASTDKKVVVKFAANFVQSGEDETDVVFVESSAKATATAAENDGGAAAGDHKIFLYVAPATAAPKLADGETDFAIDDDAEVRDNATAENLANVSMTAAAEAKGIAFGTAASDPKNSAYANVGFKLTKATYNLKEDETVDFDTTLSGLADKLEIKELGQVTGFTFKGTMNANTDWSDANISAINITPIYTVAAAGTEVAVADTQCVVTLTETTDTAEPDKPAASGSSSESESGDSGSGSESGSGSTTPTTPSVSATSVSASNASVTVTLPDGVTVTKLVLTKKNNGGTSDMVAGNNYTVSGTTYTIGNGPLTNQVGGKVTFVFSDGTSIDVNIVS